MSSDDRQLTHRGGSTGGNGQPNPEGEPANSPDWVRDILEGRLPQARRQRWQPLRAGLLNVFLFEDETFPFADGRLLLRGVNATGKSRVMAFLLPFLLDGNLHPTRLEPDREAGRQVAWNLLMGEHHDRLGYSWLELGRCDKDGAQYLTLGCGLRAVKDRGIVEHWFFLTTRRIGDDLQLTTPQQTALTRRQLAEALGDKGRVFERSGDYRRSVDEALFQLGYRYDHLLELLLCLRQPQLAKKLDPDYLESALKESLPPLAEGLLDTASETFRSLDMDRRQIQSSREALDRTKSFLDPYRQHVRIGLRRAADAVRSSNSAYESAGRRQREVFERIEKLEFETNRNEALCRQAEEEVVRLEARLGALERSEEARAASRLDDKRQLAEASRSATSRIQDVCNDATQQHQQHFDQMRSHETDLAILREGVTRQMRRTLETAAPEDLVRTHQEQLRGIGDRDDLTLETVKNLLTTRNKETDRWLRYANRLVEFNAKIRAQNEPWLAARRMLDVRESEYADLSEQVTKGAVSVTHARDKLWEEIVQWHAASVELSHGIEDLEEAKPAWEQWALRAEEGDPISLAIDEAFRRLTAQLATEQASVQQQIDHVKLQQWELQQLLERLQAGVELEPPPPSTRDPHARHGQPGVPLWRVVDFAAAVPEAERAGWEAALEASGLLDAWIMPEGQIRDAWTNDTILIAGTDEPLPPDRQLSRVLVPDYDGKPLDVALETVSAVLARIGVGVGGSRIWVDHSGRWQNGPLLGHWEKADAQFIGPAARQRHRQRKIAETTVELANGSQQEAALTAQLAQLESRYRKAHAERQQLPSADALSRSLIDLASAERLRGEAALRRDESAKIESRERAKLDVLVSERDIAAKDMDLMGWAERPEQLVKQLDDHAHELRHLERALIELVSGMESLRLARTHLERSVLALKAAQDHLRASELETRQHEVELQTLIETIGSTAEEITRLLSEVRRQLAAKRTLHRNLQQQASDSNATLAVERQQIESFQADLRLHDERRREAVNQLQMRADRGLLDVAELSIEAPSAPWSLTQGVEVARAVERLCQDLRSDDEAWQRSQTRVHTQREELRAFLSSYDLSLEPEALLDGLQLIHVPFRGTLIRIDQLLQQLAEDVTAHERILSEKERQIFEDFLLGEVGSELHHRMLEAAELVENMTREVAHRPMSTGMQMRFRWEPIDDALPELLAARDILMRMRETWSAQERESLIRFLQRQIQLAQAADQAGAWRDHLRSAFDYRRWHSLRIERRTGADQPWKRLTRNTYAALSGGEKAIALTIPQCAAAAAYYRSAHRHAPRFLLLDEAFAGISTDNRGGCLELLVSFDLDVLMTSENERGCYPAVPALAICRLSRASDLHVVLNDVFVWNGKQQAGPAAHHTDDVKMPVRSRNSSSKEAPLIADPADGRLF